MVSPAPAELRQATLKLRAEVARRLTGAQEGIPTFFDEYLARLIDELVPSEARHGWNYQPDPVAGGELGNLPVFLHWLAGFLARHDHDRLVSYRDRRSVDPRQACDIGPIELLMSQGIRGCLEWKGRPLFKTVFDFALVPMLIHDLKPATIFEIGSGTGASALWMADVCATESLTTRIHSVDIKPVTHRSSGTVTFSRGDAHDLQTLFSPDLLQTAPHPWLVVEDANENLVALLTHFDRFLQQGDYLIVEDSRDKGDEVGAFVTDRYRVDTRYTDFFGRNATSAEDAIFAVVA